MRATLLVPPVRLPLRPRVRVAEAESLPHRHRTLSRQLTSIRRRLPTLTDLHHRHPRPAAVNIIIRINRCLLRTLVAAAPARWPANRRLDPLPQPIRLKEVASLQTHLVEAKIRIRPRRRPRRRRRRSTAAPLIPTSLIIVHLLS